MGLEALLRDAGEDVAFTALAGGDSSDEEEEDDAGAFDLEGEEDYFNFALDASFSPSASRAPSVRSMETETSETTVETSCWSDDEEEEAEETEASSDEEEDEEDLEGKGEDFWSGLFPEPPKREEAASVAEEEEEEDEGVEV
jgi:hypothetical protein